MSFTYAGKTITTVVSDLDGTIFYPRGMQSLPERSREVILRLIDGGIRFIVASGRQYPNLRDIFAGMESRIGYIGENGCVGVWQDRVICEKNLDIPLAMEMVADLQEYEGIEILLCKKEESCIVPKDPQFLYHLTDEVGNRTKVLSSYEEFTGSLLKISAHFPATVPADANAYLHEKYAGRMNVTDSGNGWFDCMPLGVGKGETLLDMARDLGIGTEEIMAFGDGENDISLLQASGLAVCMESGNEILKPYGDLFCTDVCSILEECASQL
jgi:Cof subfamily protein (haloacid dehalogenase superfamily)